MIGVDPVGLSNHRGLYLYLDKSDAVYKKGEILTGTASLDLQDSLEIIGECYYSDECGIFLSFLCLLTTISLTLKIKTTTWAALAC